VIVEWVSVFLVGLCLGLSVAILVVLWRVRGSTGRVEQDGRERLEILREQQQRLGHLREEREILLGELERLREQRERLRWLQEGRAALLAELKRLRSLVEKERRRAQASPPPPPAPVEVEQRPQFTAAGAREKGRMGAKENEYDRRWRAS
jgi:septal ring factor EnvC (AmiA/AmiB activator)